MSKHRSVLESSPKSTWAFHIPWLTLLLCVYLGLVSEHKYFVVFILFHCILESLINSTCIAEAQGRIHSPSLFILLVTRVVFCYSVFNTCFVLWNFCVLSRICLSIYIVQCVCQVPQMNLNVHWDGMDDVHTVLTLIFKIREG